MAVHMNGNAGRLVTGAVMAFLLVAGLSRLAAAGEDATIKAFSAWQGQGHVFQTGEKQATFVGAFVGTVYVETDQGPVASGHMVCPATVTISLDDNSQNGTGHCTITADDGATVYADVTCSGFHLVGCNGDFKLTGGTGRFAGITGGGPVIIRSEFAKLAAAPQNTAQEEATGIVYWKELHYTIP